MGVLRISLFGSIQVAHEDVRSDTRLTPILQALLAYLLLNNARLHPRDALTGLFWGDYSEARARGCLNTALWRLRRVLEPRGIPAGTYLTTTSLGEVGFNVSSSHWLDVTVFLCQVNLVLDRPFDSVAASDISACRQALDLYTGDLLEGCYDDWAVRRREHTRLVYLNTLAYLAGYYAAHGDPETGLGYAQQILELDPLREEIHRHVMRLQVRCGRRAQAVQQYETCCKVLQQELGIEPMPETRVLYQEILDSPPPGVHATVDQAAEFQQAVLLLEQATLALTSAQHDLQLALQQFATLVHKRDPNS